VRPVQPEEARNAATIRRWFEEVWNQQRADLIDELMAPDAAGHGLGPEGGPVQDREGFKEFHRTFCGAFPDLRITIEDLMAQGDRTAIRLTCTGTHQGGHLGMPPTGRPVPFRAMVFTRLRDGQVIEGWNLVDLPSMRRQLGGD